MKGHILTNKIDCLTNYVGALNALVIHSGLDKETTHLWYRGQSQSNWDLTPQIYRNRNLNYFEREMVRDFKLHSSEFIRKKPEHEIDWLYLMQHYGLPTRLLDWSESYLVALYFAVLDYKNTNDAAVWILNPWTFNKVTFKHYSIPTNSHPIISDYCLGDPHKIERKIKAANPIAIRPIRNSPRIVAQRGAFTIHGHNTKPLNKIIITETSNKNDSDIHLQTITIDGKSKLKLLKELQYAGISYSVIFPEVQGICNDLKLKYSDDFTFKVNLSELR